VVVSSDDFVQFAEDLRNKLALKLGDYLNDTAILALFLDPTTKLMRDFVKVVPVTTNGTITTNVNDQLQHAVSLYRSAMGAPQMRRNVNQVAAPDNGKVDFSYEIEQDAIKTM
jgi:hypothetical protein